MRCLRLTLSPPVSQIASRSCLSNRSLCARLCRASEIWTTCYARRAPLNSLRPSAVRVRRFCDALRKSSRVTRVVHHWGRNTCCSSCSKCDRIIRGLLCACDLPTTICGRTCRRTCVGTAWWLSFFYLRVWW